MTEPAFVTTTRTSYDVVAEDYAHLLRDALDEKPLDRALLGSFAEEVLRDPGGPVLDLGCGPGRLTGHLRDLGLDVSGVDLSPGMVAVARRTHPDLVFEVGDVAAIPRADASLGGVLAWYSLIHTPTPDLPGVLAEIRRVLRPGGLLLLAFQTGDGPVHRSHSYGHDLDLTNHRRPVELVAGLLEEAGLTVQMRVLREPEGLEQTPQAYLQCVTR